MTPDTAQSFKPVAVARVNWLLVVLGVVPFSGTALLAARLIWEQTVWTWERGPQMVGFSLMHGSYAFLAFAPILLALWIAVALVLIVVKLVNRRKVDTATWSALGLAVLLIGLLFVPSGVWQRVFIREMAASPRAGDLIVYAGYGKDYLTVKAMLSHGVSVGAIDHPNWRTALHAAAIAGDLRIVRFLVSNGAEVNALDRAGDSPVELALSRGNQECASFLQEHGGKRIRGDDAQRQKAIEDKVHDDIEEMNRLRPH